MHRAMAGVPLAPTGLAYIPCSHLGEAGSTGGFVHPAGPAGEEGHVMHVTRDWVCSALQEALT